MKTLGLRLRLAPVLGALAVTTLLASAPVAATIIFTLGNNPQPNEENILFNGNGTVSGPALTVSGRSETSGCLASFTGTENLVTPANGQSRVEAVDGGFTNLTIGLGCTVEDIIFAINPTAPGGTGNATVNVGGSSFTYSFGPGNTFLTIVATGGDVITGLTLSSDVDIQSIRQVRISGAGPLEAPEPISLALLGIGLVALGLSRRAPRA